MIVSLWHLCVLYGYGTNHIDKLYITVIDVVVLMIFSDDWRRFYIDKNMLWGTTISGLHAYTMQVGLCIPS